MASNGPQPSTSAQADAGDLSALMNELEDGDDSWMK